MAEIKLKTGKLPHSVNISTDICNEQFFQGMVDRMTVSWYKYHNPDEGMLSLKQNHEFGLMKRGAVYDTLAFVRQRIQKYQQTGNTEWLMDAANGLMIEFQYPQHPKAHFRATDSHESPGIAFTTKRNRRESK